jgi:hypothetical protein
LTSLTSSRSGEFFSSSYVRSFVQIPSTGVAAEAGAVVCCGARSLKRTEASICVNESSVFVDVSPLLRRSHMSSVCSPLSMTAIRSERSGWRPKQAGAACPAPAQPTEPSRLLSVLAVRIVAGFPPTVVLTTSVKWAP